MSAILGLHYVTPPEWAQRVLSEPGPLLLDHLFAEKKAAAMALHTLKVHGKRFPVLKKLMTDLANEEFEHAERVEKLLKNYPKPEPQKGGNRYAQELRKLWQVRGRDNFLDMLLVCGLIEARSAERFRLLADTARGTELGNFYEDLYASEVNHYRLFSQLGADFFGEGLMHTRLEEMRAVEARVIQALPPGPRIH
ncbi:MAG TPA: tRNA isopentenyl-2-thiomethyl-A-37 hydroxylase MiaE [Planctomycetota bacterium]|nr:tRNA isopentenyl-2-thiomethyl-A-37 hydroxylase MiaE [Planctomycetota bacterium]